MLVRKDTPPGDETGLKNTQRVRGRGRGRWPATATATAMNGKWTNVVWPGICGEEGGRRTSGQGLVFRKMPTYFAEINFDVLTPLSLSVACDTVNHINKCTYQQPKSTSGHKCLRAASNSLNMRTDFACQQITALYPTSATLLFVLE